MFQSAESTITRYLDPGERLLWSGQPRQGLRLRSQDALLIPFSLLWGGFAIFWEVMVVFLTIFHKGGAGPGPAGIVMPIFGIPFVAVGLYLIFGRFFVDARGRARTFYGVTNERIVIISGLFSQQIKSLQLRSMPEISLSERTDQSGTITFGSTSFMSWFYPGGSWWPGGGRFAVPSFDIIEGAKDVYDLIRIAQRTAQ